MRILALSDIHRLESPVEKLQSIINSEKIDAIILLGGLFANQNSSDEEKSKTSIKKKKSNDTPATNILELNWLLIPVFVIPDESDLKDNKHIRQVQGQEAVWIRFLHNKGTILDNWFIFGITETEEEKESENLLKIVEEYSKIAPDRSLLIYSGNKRLQFPEIYAIVAFAGTFIINGSLT